MKTIPQQVRKRWTLLITNRKLFKENAICMETKRHTREATKQNHQNPAPTATNQVILKKNASANMDTPLGPTKLITKINRQLGVTNPKTAHSVTWPTIRSTNVSNC